jgi:hypothetical protein
MYAFSPSQTAFLYGMPKIRPQTLICEDRQFQKKRGLKTDFWIDVLGLLDPSNNFNIFSTNIQLISKYLYISIKLSPEIS